MTYFINKSTNNESYFLIPFPPYMWITVEDVDFINPLPVLGLWDQICVALTSFESGLNLYPHSGGF